MRTKYKLTVVRAKVSYFDSLGINGLLFCLLQILQTPKRSDGNKCICSGVASPTI